MNQKQNWHAQTLSQIARELQTSSTKGLPKGEARLRNEKGPHNVLQKKEDYGVVGVILAQFKSPLVFILLLAGIATLLLHEYVDAIVIAIALLINIIVGTIQEERAGNAFEKLTESQEHIATVIRDGKKMQIPAENVLEGDLLYIQSGMYVPADARIVSETDLTVNESSLTGEWIDVKKQIGSVEESAPITDRHNMIWRGTLVTNGTATALVTAIGKDTQIGVIAEGLIEKLNTNTPLQKSIKRLALVLTYVISFAIVGIFAIGLFRGEPLSEMLLISIAIAVAAMPQGLPAAVTVVLAIGMEAILKKNGLVRNLLAAETLGSTTVILTDKTGTLTKAEMRISSIVTGQSFEHKKLEKDTEKTLTHGSDERDVLAMAVLTADAYVEGYDNALSEWVVRGGPVERAIIHAGLEANLTQERLGEKNPEMDRIPFSSTLKFSATLNGAAEGKHYVYMKGAPEMLLDASTHVYTNGKQKKLTQALRKKFNDELQEKAKQGLRLIGVAYKEATYDVFPEDVKNEDNTFVSNLVFCGLLMIHDPVRDDVHVSIQEAQSAGTRVVMVTGDNANTAKRVAVEVGIAKEQSEVLVGSDLESMTDKELYKALQTVSVFARILPDQKKRLVKVLRSQGESVAMTGDGINDAPALRRADIGVALGSGTEVAKEASDLILLNNSFTIIVRAIEEGRRILDNLKKIVAYLLSTSFSEILLIAAALIIGSPLPLLPAQILWANIVEEGFMSFSFAFEPKERDVMKRDPREPGMRSIITSPLKGLIAILSIVTGLFLVGLYYLLLSFDMPIEEVRTIMFAALSIDSIFFAFSVKDLKRPLWRIPLLSNKYLLFALATSFASLGAALFVPFFQNILSLVPLSGLDLLFVLGVGLLNLITIEAVKYVVFGHRHA